MMRVRIEPQNALRNLARLAPGGKSATMPHAAPAASVESIS